MHTRICARCKPLGAPAAHVRLDMGASDWMLAHPCSLSYQPAQTCPPLASVLERFRSGANPCIRQVPSSGMTSPGRAGATHSGCLQSFHVNPPSSRMPQLVMCHATFTLLPPCRRDPPCSRHMKLQCVVAAFLLGMSSATCSRQPLSASVLATLRLHVGSSPFIDPLLLRSLHACSPSMLQGYKATKKSWHCRGRQNHNNHD